MDSGFFPTRKLSRRAFQPEDCRVEITGDLVRFRVSLPSPPNPPTKKRAPIFAFSPASRRRMLHMVASIDWRRITSGLFCTLTFPDEVLPMGAPRRNQARHQFLRSMENYLGREIGVLWRIEWEPRKSGRYKGIFLPHFHLVIPGVRYVHWTKIAKWWGQAIGWRGDVSTKTRKLSDKRHHNVYIAKYAAKAPSLSSLDYVAYLNIGGRHWGVHRPKLIPKHQTNTYDGLSLDAVRRLQSMGRDTFDWYAESGQLGFSLFGQLGEKMVDAVRRICLDEGDADW